MSFNKGILFTVVFFVEVLVLVGCNTISEPTTKSISNSEGTDHTSPTATIFQPTVIQADPNIELCKSAPEPLLNHPPSNTGEEFLSGKFYLCSIPAFSAFDFDEVKVLDKEAVEADLHLEVGKATFDNHIIYYLREENASLVDETETSNPTYSKCKELISSSSRLGYVVGSQSNSGCIQTNQGRLGFFKVTKMDPKGIESIELSFVLWNKKD